MPDNNLIGPNGKYRTPFVQDKEKLFNIRDADGRDVLESGYHTSGEDETQFLEEVVRIINEHSRSADAEKEVDVAYWRSLAEARLESRNRYLELAKKRNDQWKAEQARADQWKADSLKTKNRARELEFENERLRNQLSATDGGIYQMDESTLVSGRTLKVGQRVRDARGFGYIKSIRSDGRFSIRYDDGGSSLLLLESFKHVARVFDGTVEPDVEVGVQLVDREGDTTEKAEWGWTFCGHGEWMWPDPTHAPYVELLIDDEEEYYGPSGSWENELSNEFIETRGPREGEPIDPDKFVAPDGRLFHVGQVIATRTHKTFGKIVKQLDGRRAEVAWDSGIVGRVLLTRVRRVFTPDRPPNRVEGAQYLNVDDAGSLITRTSSGWRCSCCDNEFPEWTSAVGIGDVRLVELLEEDR